jgi:N-acetylmuramoyl-L-alanine amidase
MINLVISPTQQTGTEENLVRPLAEKLYINLKNDGLINVGIVPDYEGLTDNEALKQAVEWSNNFINIYGGNGYHLELHADAGGYGTGASGLYLTDAGKAFITPILLGIMNITPWTDIGLKRRTDLYALNQTIAYAGLLEISFYDNPEELNWMQTYGELIVQTIKEGIYTAVGIPTPAKPLSLEDALSFLKTQVEIDTEYWKSACSYVKFLDDLFINLANKWKKTK